MCVYLHVLSVVKYCQVLLFGLILGLYLFCVKAFVVYYTHYIHYSIHTSAFY